MADKEPIEDDANSEGLEDSVQDELEDELEDERIPRVVVLGAGPIGLEAALYARYLGYDVAVVEQHTVAAAVQRWGHVKMFSPFGMNSSSLGRAALQAQVEDLDLPADDALLTGTEFAKRYLLPLAKSDLLSKCVHEKVEVLYVGRDGILKSDAGDLDRSLYQFRVHVRTPGGDDVIEADVVIDTTGVTDQQNFLGHGGIPALGELQCRQHFNAPLPDILGADRAKFESKRSLVVGSGYSAATNVVALAELAKQASDTQVTWVTRREKEHEDGPLPVSDDDRLASRRELARLANSSAVEQFDQTSVVAIGYDDSKKEFTVTFGGKLAGERQFDQILANVGFRPNTGIYSELQVEQCSSSEAPAGAAGWLREVGPVDVLELDAAGQCTWETSESGFYVLGSKSFGRNSNFLLAFGLSQIRDAFTVIAGRSDLDLYATMSKLASAG